MTTTLDWYGCATFGLRSAGLHIMLDAYIDRADIAAGPQPRLTADDVADVDWIVVGHAHFDHLYGAERIMANNPACRLIANYEGVRLMEQAGVPLDRMIPVAGGETIELEGAAGNATVSVYPSQHSCVWSHAEMDAADHVCIGDLGVTWQEQRARFAELMAYVTTELDPSVGAHVQASAAGHSDRGDGGALVFLFDLPDGRLFYQDTSGHWTGVMQDLRPDVAIVGAAGRGNVDGEPIQGALAEFVARQADLMRPRQLILGHHDNWLPGFSIDTDVAPIIAEVERTVPGTEVLTLDYLDGTELF